MKKNFFALFIVITINICCFYLIGENKDIDFKSLIFSTYRLPDHWQENVSLGSKIADEESLKYRVINAWENKIDKSKIILLAKEVRGFYPPAYFQDKEQIEGFAGFYNLSKYNVLHSIFQNKSGLSIGHLEFRNNSLDAGYFRTGIWNFISAPLKHFESNYFFNCIFVIMYRTLKQDRNAKSLGEFITWRDNLTLNEKVVLKVSPGTVADMRKIQKIMAAEKQQTMKDSLKKINSSQTGQEQRLKTRKKVFKDNSTLNYTIAKWYAPNDRIRIAMFDGKKEKNGSMVYDFLSHTFIIKFNKEKKVVKYSNIGSYETRRKGRNNYHLTFILKESNKKDGAADEVKPGRIEIKITDIKYKGGLKFLEDYMNKIRKIDDILNHAK